MEVLYPDCVMICCVQLTNRCSCLSLVLYGTVSYMPVERQLQVILGLSFQEGIVFFLR